MDATSGETMAMGVKTAENLVTKSLSNIVGNLWQARQESSGSSVGNQSPRNGDDFSDGEPGSPATRPNGNANNPDGKKANRPEDNLDSLKLKDPRDLIRSDPTADPHARIAELMAKEAALAGGLGAAALPPTSAASAAAAHAAARSLLAHLPPLPGLEALQRHQRDFLAGLRTPPTSGAAAPLNHPTSALFPPITSAGGLGLGFPPLGGRPDAASGLQRPPSQPPTPTSVNSSSPVQHAIGQPPNGQNGSQNWSYEEQFKQLYDIDDNPRRRDFLDELFTFMQKRGTPINRLPIMAKQVLDLYELFNLVIARGGLVEVINKKLWQEVIKGLGLPSSITSAAFTLRTQYTKYLYPMECQKKNLSNPNDLQAAIEGNKREGRRSSYGTYPELGLHPGHPFGSISPGLALPGSGPNPSLTPQPPCSQSNAMAAAFGAVRPERQNGTPIPPNSRSPQPQDPMSAIEMTRLALLKMYQQQGNGSLPGLPGLPNLPPEMLAAVAAAQQNQSPSTESKVSPFAKLGLPQPPALPMSPGQAPPPPSAASHPNLPPSPAQGPHAEMLRLMQNQQKLSAMNSRQPERRKLFNDDEDMEDEDASEDSELDRNRGRKRKNNQENENDQEIDLTARSFRPSSPKRTLVDLERSSAALREKQQIANNSPSVDCNFNNGKAPSAKDFFKNNNTTLGLPGANIKITSRGAQNGDSDDKSLVVSMEINGITYQGVLFANINQAQQLESKKISSPKKQQQPALAIDEEEIEEEEVERPRETASPDVEVDAIQDRVRGEESEPQPPRSSGPSSPASSGEVPNDSS